MKSYARLHALVEVHRIMVGLQREINASHMTTFLGVALWADDDEPLTIKTLSVRVGLGQTTTARHVRYLGGGGDRAEQNGLGLLTTIQNPEDAREKLVVLTPYGSEIMDRIEDLIALRFNPLGQTRESAS